MSEIIWIISEQNFVISQLIGGKSFETPIFREKPTIKGEVFWTKWKNSYEVNSENSQKWFNENHENPFLLNFLWCRDCGSQKMKCVHGRSSLERNEKCTSCREKLLEHSASWNYFLIIFLIFWGMKARPLRKRHLFGRCAQNFSEYNWIIGTKRLVCRIV